MIAVATDVLIYGAYAAVAAVLGAYSIFVVVRGRRLAEEVDDDGKYWS